MGTIHISPHERLKKYALKDIEQLYNDFHVKEGGLTQEQIEQMRKQHGSNHVGYSLQAHSFFQRIKRAFINPFSVILFVLAIVSFITDVCLKSNSGRNGTSVVIILSMLIISGMVRLIQERKAGHAADTLIQQIKTTVSVYRQGQQLEISSEELVVGDTVSLSAGERVPADLRLIEAQDLFVSQALLTGESNVLEKNTNRLASATQIPLDRFSNIAFMGSSVISGEGKGIVLAVGGSTVYGGYLSELQRNKHSFDTGANSIAWVLIRFIYFYSGKAVNHITAWKTMPEEEKRKIHIRPLCRNVGMMIATSGIIFLLSGAWYAFRKSGFLWCMVGWMVLSGADVYWIGKSGRYQSSGK